VAAVTGLLVAGCASSDDAGGAQGGDQAHAITVSSTDDACKLSTTKAPAGTLTFEVTNDGSDVTEFYLLAEDGKRVLGEVENIGPGLSRNLVVKAPEGGYVTACKPGMSGDGIRADFTVTASQDGAEVTRSDQQRIDRATRGYQHYVEEQTDELLGKTRQFVARYTAGDDAAARALYPRARVHWERIETVAESFGDLDPRMDLREADLEPGQEWTGWHRLEKDLWPPAGYTPLTAGQREKYAQDLLRNTRILDRRVETLHLTLDQIANGSRGLLEEVATGKVTGEEERWSHTDLWDFQANVDGARVGYRGVRPVLQEQDPALARTIDRRFADLQRLLDRHRRGDGFVSYQSLSDGQVKELSNAVNALAEPLSGLTAAVLA
jgi:iron uptake system component EfeO